MADARITTTTAAADIPELWGSVFLGKLAGSLILAGIVNRDFARTQQEVGDIVNVRIRGAVTTSLKSSGAAVEAQAPTTSNVQVALDKHRIAAFACPSEVDATADHDVLGGYLEDAAVAIAEDMEIDGLTAAYTGFTTNTVGAAGSALTEANIISCREKLVLAKCPQGAPRYMFLYPTAVSTALGIARLTEADKLGIPAGPIRDGAVGKIHGFTVIESQYVVVTAGAPDETKNIALSPDAMTIAMRTLKQPRSPNVLASVAEGTPGTPTSGLGIRITMAWDGTYLADRATAEALYGWKVVRETLGVAYAT